LALKQKGAQVEIVDGLQVNNLLTYTSSDVDIPNRDLYVKVIKSTPGSAARGGIPLHVQDARDYHALSHTLTKINPQVIIHLAAISHAGKIK